MTCWPIGQRTSAGIERSSSGEASSRDGVDAEGSAAAAAAAGAPDIAASAGGGSDDPAAEEDPTAEEAPPASGTKTPVARENHDGRDVALPASSAARDDARWCHSTSAATPTPTPSAAACSVRIRARARTATGAAVDAASARSPE